MARRAAPPGKEFVFRTNSHDTVGVACSLKEFEELVSTVDDASIAYHLREECNDFAAWAADGLDNKALSRRLAGAKRAKKPNTRRTKVISAIKGPAKRRKKA